MAIPLYSILLDIAKYIIYKKIYKDINGSSYTINSLIEMSDPSALGKDKSVDDISKTLQSRKKSDTLIIMGSGTSLISLNKLPHSLIEKFDIMGFNYSCLFPVKPDFYLYQADVGEEYDTAQRNAVFINKSLLSDTMFIFRPSKQTENLDLDCSELSWIKDENRSVVVEYPISNDSNIEPSKYFNFFYSLGILRFGLVGRIVPKWVGTVGLALSLGYVMGYKKIILSGCDMSDNRHFWDIEPYNELHKILKLRSPDKSNIYKFNNKLRLGFTAVDWIASFEKFCSEKGGSEIYTLGPGKLSGILPQFELNV